MVICHSHPKTRRVGPLTTAAQGEVTAASRGTGAQDRDTYTVTLRGVWGGWRLILSTLGTSTGHQDAAAINPRSSRPELVILPASWLS